MRSFIVLAAGIGLGAPALAGDVVVQVSGLADAAGKLAVAICTQAEFLKTCRIAATVPARAGTVLVKVPAVASGRYAVQAHHDRDGNGQIATTLVGLPSEPVGFSRDATMRFGPPRFEDAAIDVGQGPTHVAVRVKTGP